MVSRILGLLRDVLFFATFGASMFGEAFLLAFTFPNLFRRMLGEGTLNSAFLPVFTTAWNETGRNRAWALLNQIVSRMLLYLGVLALLICLGSWSVSYCFADDGQKWFFAARLNGITFAYLIFICTSAILVGALNVRGRFFEGAISPVILNLCMIICLVLAQLFAFQDLGWVACLLGISVVGAGCLQLWLPWRALKVRESWGWSIDLSGSSDLNSVKSLFWVGALGAAVAQVNLLISRFLAYSLDETGGLSFLYMAARMVELPLGVFAIAISTVLFPKLSKASTQGNAKGYEEAFFLGMRTIGAITLPSAVGLYVLADPILRLLFQWNAFGPEETVQAVNVLRIAAWTIPFYAYSSFMVKAFHSEKNMTTPYHGAIVSLLINLIASLVLMQKYGVLGLAWANFISAFSQLVFLCWKNQYLQMGDWLAPRKISSFSPLIGCTCMYFLLAFLLPRLTQIGGKTGDLITLSVLVPSAILSFFLVLKMMRFSWTLTASKQKGS